MNINRIFIIGAIVLFVLLVASNLYSLILVSSLNSMVEKNEDDGRVNHNEILELRDKIRNNGSLFGGGSSIWGLSGSSAYYNDGNVGIGITTPRSKLSIIGNTSFRQLRGIKQASPIFRVTGQDMLGNNVGDFEMIANFGVQSASDTYTSLSVRGVRVVGNVPGIELGIAKDWNGGKLESYKSVMTFKDNGNVGIGTTVPTTILEVACPDGFTNVKSGNNQLGCIQTDENKPMYWTNASNFCFTTYGGRLPTTGEWYIAAAYFDLYNETNNSEWNDDAVYDKDQPRHAASGLGSISNFGAAADGFRLIFRCWIPR